MEALFSGCMAYSSLLRCVCDVAVSLGERYFIKMFGTHDLMKHLSRLARPTRSPNVCRCISHTAKHTEEASEMPHGPRGLQRLCPAIQYPRSPFFPKSLRTQQFVTFIDEFGRKVLQRIPHYTSIQYVGEVGAEPGGAPFWHPTQTHEDRCFCNALLNRDQPAALCLHLAALSSFISEYAVHTSIQHNPPARPPPFLPTAASLQEPIRPPVQESDGPGIMKNRNRNVRPRTVGGL